MQPAIPSSSATNAIHTLQAVSPAPPLTIPSNPSTSKESVESSAPPTPPAIDLTEKEASAREKLLARKAEIARKNAEKAQRFMEAELQGLLQASTTAPSPSVSQPTAVQENCEEDTDMDIDSGGDSDGHGKTLQTEEEGQGQEAEEGEVSEDDQGTPTFQFAPDHVKDRDIHEMRERVLALGDEASGEPVQDPFVDTHQRYTYTRNPTLIVNRNQSTSRRPVAIDFESEPVQSLPNVPRWNADLVPSSRAKEMVIDLSDDESSEEEGSDVEELRNALQEAKQQQDHHILPQIRSSRQSSNPPSKRNSPPMSARTLQAVQPQAGISEASATPSAHPTVAAPLRGSTPGSSGAALSQLEAKQDEIRRMMERIAQLESKKKSSGSHSVSRSGTPTVVGSLEVPTPPAVTSTPSSPNLRHRDIIPSAASSAAAASVAIRAAKEEVGRLLEQQAELAHEIRRAEAEMGSEHSKAVATGNEAKHTLEADSTMETVRGAGAEDAKDVHDGQTLTNDNFATPKSATRQAQVDPKSDAPSLKTSSHQHVAVPSKDLQKKGTGVQAMTAPLLISANGESLS